jgi:Tol biopolymer transport system component
MDVNEATRKIALSVTFAGSDITGLWTMNLDGSDLKRIITPERNEKYLQAINKPSWTPDGKWIVFEEELRGMNPNRSSICICDATGKQFRRLLEAKDRTQYSQPSVSPDGKQIVYVHWFKWASWISLMNIDGTNPRQIPNPDDRRNTHGGTWPAWSPDGKRVMYSGVAGVVADPVTGKRLWVGEPGGEGLWGWPHWGRSGIVGYAVRGVMVMDAEFRESKLIGASRGVKCAVLDQQSCRW